MPKEYRTIQEVAGPLMLVKGVSGVSYNDLGEIELTSGEVRRCTSISVEIGRIWNILDFSFIQDSHDFSSAFG